MSGGTQLTLSRRSGCKGIAILIFDEAAAGPRGQYNLVEHYASVSVHIRQYFPAGMSPQLGYWCSLAPIGTEQDVVVAEAAPRQVDQHPFSLFGHWFLSAREFMLKIKAARSTSVFTR